MELQPSSMTTVICSYCCMYATRKPRYLALLYSSLFDQCDDRTAVTKVVPCIYGVATSAATKINLNLNIIIKASNQLSLSDYRDYTIFTTCTSMEV